MAKVIFPDRTKYKIKFSDELMDIVEKLLIKDPKKRLGAKNGAKEVLSHPFFNDIDIDALYEKKLKPPFIPDFGDNEEFNKKLFNVEDNFVDTFIPTSSKKIIQKKNDKFAEMFASNNIKK